MSSFLQSLAGKSNTIFGLAAGLLVLYALGAGINTFTDSVIGGIIKEIFQAAGYGLAFIGGLSLLTKLVDDGKWLSRVGAVLAGIGSLGATVLFIGYLLEPIGVIANVPGWVDAYGLGIPLGQIGMLLFGLAALQSEEFPTAIGLALMGPLLAFVLFFIGAGILGTENAPYWAPFATVLLQTIAHLLLAWAFTGDFTLRSEPAAQPTA